MAKRPQAIQRPPRAAIALIAANVAAFLAIGGWAGSEQALVRLGAAYAPRVAAGEWWRLGTSVLLHASALSLAGHCLAISLAFGLASRRLGAARALGVYALSGLGAAVTGLVLHPYSANLGSSGAVFGLLGAAAACLLRTDPGERRQAIRRLGLGLLGAAAFGSRPGIEGTFVPVLGLATGFLLGLAHARAPRAFRLASASIAAALALVVMAQPRRSDLLHELSLSQVTLGRAAATAKAFGAGASGQALTHEQTLERVSRIQHEIVEPLIASRERILRLGGLGDQAEARSLRKQLDTEESWIVKFNCEMLLLAQTDEAHGLIASLDAGQATYRQIVDRLLQGFLPELDQAVSKVSSSYGPAPSRLAAQELARWRASVVQIAATLKSREVAAWVQNDTTRFLKTAEAPRSTERSLEAALEFADQDYTLHVQEIEESATQVERALPREASRELGARLQSYRRALTLCKAYALDMLVRIQFDEVVSGLRSHKLHPLEALGAIDRRISPALKRYPRQLVNGRAPATSQKDPLYEELAELQSSRRQALQALSSGLKARDPLSPLRAAASWSRINQSAIARGLSIATFQLLSRTPPRPTGR